MHGSCDSETINDIIDPNSDVRPLFFMFNEYVFNLDVPKAWNLKMQKDNLFSLQIYCNHSWSCYLFGNQYHYKWCPLGRFVHHYWQSDNIISVNFGLIDVVFDISVVAFTSTTFFFIVNIPQCCYLYLTVTKLNYTDMPAIQIY